MGRIQWTHETATAFMLEAGFEPLEPFTKSAAPWLSTHLTCKEQSSPRLADVKTAVDAGRTPQCTSCNGRAPISAEAAAEAMLAAGFQPLEPFTIAKAPWLCVHLACDGECRPALADVKSAVKEGRTYNCRHCAGKAQISAEEAVLAMRAAGFEPMVPYPGIDGRWESRCTKAGHVVFPTLNNVRRGHGCKGCDTLSRVDTSREEYGAIALALLASKNLDPIGPYPGALADWEVSCRVCGLVSRIDFNRLRSADWHCPCIRQAQLVEARTDHVTSHGWTVVEIPRQEPITKMWTMRHSCGFVHRIDPWSVGRYGPGCPKCAGHGFNPSIPGFLYLLKIPAHNALKVGITNNFKLRMSQHRHNFDFALLGRWWVESGTVVRRHERSVLNLWSPFGAVPTLAGIDGCTETVSLEDVSAQVAIASINEMFASASAL